MTGTLLLSVLVLLAVEGNFVLGASTIAPGAATAITTAAAADVTTASSSAAPNVPVTTTSAPGGVSGTLTTASTTTDPMAIVALLQQQIQQLTAQLAAQRQIAEQQAAALAKFQAAQFQRPQPPTSPLQTTPQLQPGSGNVAPQPQQPNPMDAVLAQYLNMMQQQQQQQQQQPAQQSFSQNNQVLPMGGLPQVQPFKPQTMQQPQQPTFTWQQQPQQSFGSFPFRPQNNQAPTPATRFNSSPMRSTGFPMGNNFWQMAMMTDFF